MGLLPLEAQVCVNDGKYKACDPFNVASSQYFRHATSIRNLVRYLSGTKVDRSLETLRYPEISVRVRVVYPYRTRKMLHVRSHLIKIPEK